MERNNDEYDDYDEEYLTPNKKFSPFGAEQVDPIVYAPPTDSPELRAEAAYIPVSSKLQIREAKPVPKRKKDYGSWIPGGESEKNREVKGKIFSTSGTGVGKTVKYIMATIIVVIPVTLVYFAVRYGMSLYAE